MLSGARWRARSATSPGEPQAAAVAASLGCRDSTWDFSVLMEEPSIENEENSLSLLGQIAFFHVLVVCHQRPTNNYRYAGCKEYSWRISRRFSDFMTLDAALRASNVLPSTVAVPRKSLVRHLLPTKEFATQRAWELHRFLVAALDAVAAQVAADPARFGDSADVCQALPRFLGLKEQMPPAAHKGSVVRPWALPADAEERQAALVYSFDSRGTFVYGHDGAPGSRIIRFARQADFGGLKVTHAEVRGEGKAAAAVRNHRSSSDVGSDGKPQGRRAWAPLSPQLSASSSPQASRWPSDPASLCSSPSVSLLPSPVVTPPASRCHTPRPGGAPAAAAPAQSGDDCNSFSSISTADTECSWSLARPQAVIRSAVWLEVDLDTAWERCEEHRKWWRTIEQRQSPAKAIRGASRIDSVAAAQRAVRAAADRVEARRKTLVEYEKAAALYREIGASHEELHTILGYGVDAQTFVVVQQAAPSSLGLRSFPFTPQRCHNVLGQALKALTHLHEQLLPHGHLSPESFIIEERSMGPQVRLAWTPGQRRPEGHAFATLGFRAPGPAGVAGDIWSLACVILVWWLGFEPVPHPWTQFARSHRLQQDIHQALAQQPPLMPKAFLDLHSKAAAAEEPEHSFLSLLASVLTGCLCWDPAERPTAAQLLQHRFFEQAL